MIIEPLTLFSAPPSHATDPQTSRAAAEVAAISAPALRDSILRYLLRVGDHGGTAFECWQACGGKYPHVAGTRLGELAKPKAGPPLVEQTEQTRPTDTGSRAVVWTLTPAGRVAASVIRTAA